MLCRVTEVPGSRTAEHTYFDIQDEKGRAVGAFAHKWAADAVPANYGYTVPNAGRVFGFYPMATRNGKPYGASNGRQFFATEAERDAAADKYIADCRKRYARKYG